MTGEGVMRMYSLEWFYKENCTSRNIWKEPGGLVKPYRMQVFYLH